MSICSNCVRIWVWNWRIIQAPIAFIEYVLAHELVHVEHPYHGREFWAALGWMMPDYEERRKRLRVLGPALECSRSHDGSTVTGCCRAAPRLSVSPMD